MTDYIKRADAIDACCRGWNNTAEDCIRNIKALPSAELPNGDMISRADAMAYIERVINSGLGRNKSLDYIHKYISALPSAESEWIPCSERLPKRDELVLVTYKTTDRIHLCRYLDDGSENPWWSYIDDCCAWNNVVLAWMPLPMPYREDGEA